MNSTLQGMPDPRPLDHLVLAARDLDALKAAYERLGFQVGARNRHPWGTQNHLVQLDGAFLELISTGQGFAPPRDVDPGIFSFAGFIAGYLTRDEGLAMMVLRSADAKADAAEFRHLGIGPFEPFHFERRGRKPDGSEMQVGFTLAFAVSKLLPGMGFFTCQQHFPQNFWDKAFQSHENGALSLKSAIIIAQDPSDHAEFLSHFSGQREMLATSLGLEIIMGPSKIEVLTPLAFEFQFGPSALGETAALPRFAAYRIAVSDLAATQALLVSRGVPFNEAHGHLVVPPSETKGVAVSFEQA